MAMFRIILRITGVLLTGFACAAAGMLLGALYGGNYATEFVFNGVRGYEATGQIGLILGALTGLIGGWLLLFKARRDHPKDR